MNFSNDPLLNYQQPTENMLRMDSDELSRKIAELQQRRASINMQAQQSQTPIFDEIDKLQDGLSGTQLQYMMNNQEFVESLQYITKLVQDEELRVIRPRVETSRTGQDALKKHLTLMQKLKKEAMQAEERKNAEREEYFNDYADKMTYAEFVAMKQGKKGGKK